MTRKVLINEILPLSEGDYWAAARQEWELEWVMDVEKPETCLCGHFPINELCVLRNNKNGRSVTVGNVCVRQFTDLKPDLILQAFQRIKSTYEGKLNKAAIKYAYKKGWMTGWEQGFYLDIRNMRSLSVAQSKILERINDKVTQGYDRATTRHQR